MAKIISAHIGDLLHTWGLDNGGKLIVDQKRISELAFAYYPYETDE